MSSDSENDELDGDNAFAAAAEGTANEEAGNLFGSSDEEEAEEDDGDSDDNATGGAWQKVVELCRKYTEL